MIMFSVLLSNTRGFSYGVHRFMGNALEEYLKLNDPRTHFEMIKRLEGTSFSNASTWADKVKRTARWSWTRRLHYTNINECRLHEPINDDGIIGTLLDIPRRESFTHKELAMFVLHLLQDITQPLHLSGRLRGGNGFDVIRNKNGRNRTTNLHYIWDTEIPATLIQSGYDIPKNPEFNISLIDIVNKKLHANCEWIFPIDGYIVYEEYYNDTFIRNAFDDYIYFSAEYLKKFVNTSLWRRNRQEL